MDFTVDYLRECFRLDEDTYQLYWKIRPEHHFASKRAQGRFNTQFAGNLCGMVYEADSKLKYIRVKFHQRSLLAHRIVWSLVYGEIPIHDIDHIDGDGLNNRPSNLRLCSPEISFNNSRNRKLAVNNTSGRTGVYWRKDRSKWVAKGRIYLHDGTFEDFYLGSFSDVDEAIKARQVWEVEHGFEYRGL